MFNYDRINDPKGELRDPLEKESPRPRNTYYK